METLTVRLSEPGDLAEVDVLFASSYSRLLSRSYPPSVLVTALPILSRAQPRLLASGRYFVAEGGGGRIVGAGGWSPSRSAGGLPRAEVRHLVTDWRMTRRGVGRAVMAHVFAHARQAGAGAIDCVATLGAVPFYQAVGFRSLGPVTVALRPGIEFQAMRMERALTSA